MTLREYATATLVLVLFLMRKTVYNDNVAFFRSVSPPSMWIVVVCEPGGKDIKITEEKFRHCIHRCFEADKIT